MTATPTTLFDLDNSFARDLNGLYVDWQPTAVPQPELVAFNAALAKELGADPAALQSPEGLALLGGNAVPDGATPIAMGYSGHQFGGYSPSLGDGRALLLGEVINAGGRRRDVHLKGSGRTPFARGGDGKAALGPMLREYLIAEAMHALGVPTTRALAVVGTGEQIARDGMVPGAVLTRVAASHLRVGTFEYAARLDDPTALQRLADYSIERHYPAAVGSSDQYVQLLDGIVEAQAALVSHWMLVGFVHGVMNTDNVTVSGEGIDYGPCAFMDRYDPATVFSSIDHAGRYAFGNQPSIAQWNLTRFAETLLPLIDGDRDTAIAAATEGLDRFPERFRRHWQAGMRAKLGLATESDGDAELFGALLEMLHAQRADYTTSFRSLADVLRGDEQPWFLLTEGSDSAGEWVDSWQARLKFEGRDPVDAAGEMDGVNPLYVPRNYLVEHSLEAAHDGDLEPFRQLLDVVTEPFEQHRGLERFTEPAPESFDETYQTFCGT